MMKRRGAVDTFDGTIGTPALRALIFDGWNHDSDFLTNMIYRIPQTIQTTRLHLPYSVHLPLKLPASYVARH